MTSRVRGAIGLTVTIAAAAICGMCTLAFQGIATSGSAGIGAVSVGISEGLAEGLLIVLPLLLWVYWNTRPTRLRVVQRYLQIGVALVALAIVGILAFADDFALKVNAAILLFPLIAFSVLAHIALRIAAPVAETPNSDRQNG